MAQNQLSAQAVQSGAFGGGREGVQRAEQERARLGAVGEAQQQDLNCIRCCTKSTTNWFTSWTTIRTTWCSTTSYVTS
jgi:hypothetical protein